MPQAGGAAPSRWVACGLVAVGAAVGAAARAGVTAVFGHAHTVAGLWTILAINLVGAFLLGGLTEATAGASRRQQLVKVTIGTGVLGGFTTYSTFAVDVATAGSGGPLPDVLVYLVATLLLGPVAALLGISAWGSVARRAARGRSAC